VISLSLSLSRIMHNYVYMESIPSLYTPKVLKTFPQYRTPEIEQEAGWSGVLGVVWKIEIKKVSFLPPPCCEHPQEDYVVRGFCRAVEKHGHEL